MAENDNSTTYGISVLAPNNSVNIGQSGIYNPTTPVWTNGVLNKFENLQGLVNGSPLFADYNIFEQTNINDIFINSSIFKDAVYDSSVLKEPVYFPIEMCTLHQVVEKVLPFAPYVYKNYYVDIDGDDENNIYGFLMTDDESTYCPTYS